MEVGDATSSTTCPANYNANNHALSDGDVKLSFADSVDHRDEEIHASENTGKETEYQPESQAIDNNHQDDVEIERQKWLDEVEQERSEWEALDIARTAESGATKTTLSVPFHEALEYFLSKDLDKSEIKPVLERTRFRALLHFLFGPPKIRDSLTEDRDAIFCIAKIQLEDGEEIHDRVLQTIYKNLTGSKYDCPRKGSHWQDIGFQGNDPATDLRGVGFLGLMHILYAICDADVAALFLEFFRLSLHEEQNYPFCVMSFNVTRITLEVLREERLNREINKANGAMRVVNRFYMALFYHIFKIWKTQHKTMKDSGYVIQEAEKTARKYPKRLLKTLEVALEKRPVSKVPNVQTQPASNVVYERKMSLSSSHESNKEYSEIVEKAQENDLQYFSDIRHMPTKHEPVTDL